MKLIIDCPAKYHGLPVKELQLAADMAETTESVSLPCYVRLEITDDKGIRAVNAQQRGLDASTDVLSFPTISYPKGKSAAQCPRLLKQEWDIEQRACFLGDIVISMEHALSQAAEYGHSVKRELCYLLVHGLFHLFGYDHMLEEDKLNMRTREETALNQAGITRDQTDAILLEKAKEAMENAYAPYSHYQVGACLLCDDGRMFTGCNIENASYGLTNCAERTAVFKAVSEGATRFTAIAIAAKSMPPWPCGACRQVLSEFCGDIKVLITWGDGKVEVSSLDKLLPHSFSPASGAQEHLGKE